MAMDCSEIIPVSLKKFKLLSKVYAENNLYIATLVTNREYGFLSIRGTGETTYYVRAKMKTLEKYLRDLGSNMDFKKVERQLVKVTFGD